MRLIRLMGWLLLLSTLNSPRSQLASAADINKGYTFTAGEKNVTHTKLNNLVDAATINTSFFTDKSATTAPAAADTLLLYSAANSAYRKVSYDNLLLSQSALITGQTEDTTPATNDWVLTYDSSAGLLKKAQLNSFWTNAALIDGRAASTAPSGEMYFLGYDSGTFSKVTRSNLVSQFANFATFTNLAMHGQLANTDTLLVYSSATGTNRQTTLPGLITNALAPSTVSGGDLVYGYSTNYGKPAKYTLTQLRDLFYPQPGMTLQTLFTNKTNTESIAAGAWTDVTNLTVTLTPRNTNSQVLVRANLAASSAGDGFFRLVRDGTAIGVGAAAGSRTQVSAGSLYHHGATSGLQTRSAEFLDSPASASAVTYKVQVFAPSATILINRSATDTDNATHPRAASSLTVQEIAQ